MGVNNESVHNYIQNALDKSGSGNLLPRLDAAFQDVNFQRSKECENVDLAAADHYLISRFIICKCSPAVATVYCGMIATYDGLYKGARWAIESVGGGDIVFKTGNCRASPFSPLVIAWAFTGVSDGTVDCAGPLWQSNPKIYAPNYPAGYLSRLF